MRLGRRLDNKTANVESYFPNFLCLRRMLPGRRIQENKM